MVLACTTELGPTKPPVFCPEHPVHRPKALSSGAHPDHKKNTGFLAVETVLIPRTTHFFLQKDGYSPLTNIAWGPKKEPFWGSGCRLATDFARCPTKAKTIVCGPPLDKLFPSPKGTRDPKRRRSGLLILFADKLCPSFL